MRKFFKKITTRPTSSESKSTSHELISGAKIINYLCSVCVGITTFFFLIHLFFTKIWIHAFICVVVTLLFGIPLYFNLTKRHSLAQTMLYWVAVVGLLIASVTVGYRSGVQILYLIAFNLFYIAFLNENRTKLYARFILLTVCFVCVEHNAGGFFNGISNLSESVNSTLNFVFKMTTVIMIGVMTHFSMKIIQVATKDKEESYKIIREQKEDINTILQNLKQGVFTLGDEGRINPDYSNQLLNILEVPSLNGLDIKAVLEHGFVISSDAMNMLVNAVIASINSSELNFIFNERLFPNKMTFIGSFQTKHLEIDWVPIIDQGIVVKILVSIKDNTELVHVKEQQKDQEESQNILIEIINSKIEDFDANFIELGKHVTVSLEMASKIFEPELILEIRRHLHTLKGEARYLQWKTLANAVNIVENDLDRLGLKNSKNIFVMDFDSDQIQGRIRSLGVVLNKYKDLFDSRLRVQSNNSNAEDLKIAVEKFSQRKDPDIKAYKNLFIRFQKIFTHKYLSEILSFHKIEVASLARELDKNIPKITFFDNEIVFRKSSSSFFTRIFSHLFTNSVDHGIEVEKIRKKKGKPAEGSIVVRAMLEKDSIVITMQDDGAGLNLDKIAENAKKVGLTYSTRTELANLIFEAGLTTKVQKTEYSGQGIGLNAVRETVENAGGQIFVVLCEPEDQGPYAAFYFKIVLARDFAISEYMVEAA